MKTRETTGQSFTRVLCCHRAIELETFFQSVARSIVLATTPLYCAIRLVSSSRASSVSSPTTCGTFYLQASLPSLPSNQVPKGNRQTVGYPYFSSTNAYQFASTDMSLSSKTLLQSKAGCCCRPSSRQELLLLSSSSSSVLRLFESNNRHRRSMKRRVCSCALPTCTQESSSFTTRSFWKLPLIATLILVRLNSAQAQAAPSLKPPTSQPFGKCRHLHLH